ncbi:hypothetical protein MMC24_007389 [Lignoscripta atroalba]|nr:hypothetical protein [Lignoscripta atroalba]
MSNRPPAGHFNMLYFASAASFTKKTSEHLPAPLEATKLFDILEKKYPGIRQRVLSSCAVTINLDYIDIEEDSEADGQKVPVALVIHEGDEVALIPPVSSG